MKYLQLHCYKEITIEGIHPAFGPKTAVNTEIITKATNFRKNDILCYLINTQLKSYMYQRS